MNVDFPAPFGPSNPTHSPDWHVEIEFLDRDEVAEALGHASCADGRGVPFGGRRCGVAGSPWHEGSISMIAAGAPDKNVVRASNAADVEAVVPTACLFIGPWHKGLYN